jgi:hypothetical protein
VLNLIDCGSTLRIFVVTASSTLPGVNAELVDSVATARAQDLESLANDLG